jgi:hypothetical protein
MHMSDQGGENLSVSGLRLRAHEIDDMLCEIWVEFAGLIGSTVGTVCSHDAGLFLVYVLESSFLGYLNYKTKLDLEEE